VSPWPAITKKTNAPEHFLLEKTAEIGDRSLSKSHRAIAGAAIFETHV